MRFSNAILLVGFALLSACGTAAAQGYPNRPVTIIVTYPPGGTTDIATRIVAQRLSDSLGQAFIVENRPGAGGAIGWGAAAKAAPDGYTLVALDTAFAMAPGIVTNLAVDPRKDFVHISEMAAAPFVMVVPPASQARSAKEFIALAKASPGKLNYSSGGVGNSAHLVAEWFSSLADVRLTHVPYKGGAPMNQAITVNEVQVGFPTLPSAMAMIKAGKLRPLMVTNDKRLASLPDVPSAPEAGLPEMIGNNWFTIAAPARTPPEIVELLAKAIAAAVNDPATRQRLESAGLTPVSTSPRETTEMIEKDMQRWAGVAKAANIKAD